MGSHRKSLHGSNADKTFFAQSAFVFPVVGKEDAYIAMFDMWKKKQILVFPATSNCQLSLKWMTGLLLSGQMIETYQPVEINTDCLNFLNILEKS